MRSEPEEVSSQTEVPLISKNIKKLLMKNNYAQINVTMCLTGQANPSCSHSYCSQEDSESKILFQKCARNTNKAEGKQLLSHLLEGRACGIGKEAEDWRG